MKEQLFKKRFKICL